MDLTAVPHGFRSTFRDWCSEATTNPREGDSVRVGEAAEHHGRPTVVHRQGQRPDTLASALIGAPAISGHQLRKALARHGLLFVNVFGDNR